MQRAEAAVGKQLQKLSSALVGYVSDDGTPKMGGWPFGLLFDRREKGALFDTQTELDKLDRL